MEYGYGCDHIRIDVKTKKKKNTAHIIFGIKFDAIRLSMNRAEQ